MKQTLFYLISGAFLMVSCNESNQPANTSPAKDTSATVENKIMIPSSACYFFTNGKDSFRLKVEVFPNVVTGKISNKFSEKDSNEGEFNGHLRGDTLLADYQFSSEGKISTREVIYLLKDSIASEGYGDMEEKAGKMVFKDVKEVTFGKGLNLKKGDCGEY